jgi:hypothetical protein
MKYRRLQQAEHEARMGKMNPYRILVWKHLGKHAGGRRITLRWVLGR